MAVLDEKGDMICNANINLIITDPKGNKTTLSSSNKLITVNPACYTKDLTLSPDYQASYQITQVGTYSYTLTASTRNGIYSISDTFKSENNPQFTIKRLTATRIYPVHSYPVSLEITANQDFTGTITESVPANFFITGTRNAAIIQKDDRQLISWQLSLSKGSKTTLSYNYKAPMISPERYLLGPLQFSQNNNLVFTEYRQWQIASDATTDTFTSDGTWSVPTGVTSIFVEAWGGGGAGGGGGATNKYGGGGGAGGQYVNKTIAVSTGTSYAVTVGAGGIGVASANGNVGEDSSFAALSAGTTHALAKGGAAGKRFVGTTGPGGIGSTTDGIGDTVYRGGNGYTGTTTGSGSGGGGAGSTGNSGDATGILTYGTGTSANGGNGGIGTSANNAAGGIGDSYGGGGGGATRTSTSGDGGAGYLTITYSAANVAPTIPTSLQTNAQTNPNSLATTTPYFSAIFSDANASDTGENYQIQVDDDSGFGSTAWDSGSAGTSLPSSCVNNTRCSNINYAGSVLSLGVTYYWRIKYWDQVGATSPWSANATFSLNQGPIQPTNTTPGNGTSAVSLTPTLTASAFSDLDVGDSQAASQFQVATDSGFTSVVWQTGTSGPASNSTDVTTALSVGTTYYWHVRYQDNNGNWSTYSTGTHFITNKNPNAPTLISPANSATGVTLNPPLSLVTTDGDSNNLQYKIILATNASFTGTTQTFTADDIGWSGADIGTSSYSSGTTAAFIIQTPLDYTTTYYWRAQAIDYSGSNNWSNLSIGYSFTTMNAPPSAPTILWTQGSANPTGVTTTAPYFSAVYNDLDIGDTANKYQIQVDDDSLFGSTIWDSGSGGTAMSNCTQGNRCQNITYAGSALTRGVIYYWRIKYWDISGAAGAWSTGSNTFSINSIPNTPTLISPANSATGVTLNPPLSLVTTDGDSNNLQYKIILATNASFTGTTQVFDQTVSNIGWSGQDIGTSAYASGTTATYTIPTLGKSTTYYWKSQAIDYAGSNIWSSFSSTFSFTTDPGPSFRFKGIRLKGVKVN